MTQADADAAELLIQLANAELADLNISGVSINLDLPMILGIISFTQIALRHPEAAPTPTGRRVRAFITQLIEDITPADGPLRELLLKGFDPAFDVIQPEATPHRKKLRNALEESVKLQSHYAQLLNIYDGGERLQFANADEWLARLDELEATNRAHLWTPTDPE